MSVSSRKSPRIWIFMADARNSQDLRDLDHLDGILWGANPNTQKGDLVLMYRTAPYSDIAYVFRAQSQPREDTKPKITDMPYVIELGEKVRLQQPLALRQIKTNRALTNWSFARNQQGTMRRRTDIREEGYWQPLLNLLITNNKSLRPLLSKLEGRAPSRKKVKIPPLRVFISYASEDRKRIKRLYKQLIAEKGIKPWVDYEELEAGVEWEPRLENELRTSDAAIICVSSHSVRKIGFVNKEIRWSLELADRQPEGTTFILPVKLERCEAPGRLSKWQFVDLFEKDGYQKLLKGLRGRASFLAEN